MLNPFRALRGFMRRKDLSRANRPRRRYTRVVVEPLESRRVLAASGMLPAITGIVYLDNNANGSPDTGEGLQGAQVLLFQDDGDGNFDAGVDTQIGAPLLTDANGEYCFESLDQDESYFVQQPSQTVSGNTLAEQVSALISVSPQLIVDSFETTQSTAALPPPVSFDESALLFGDEIEVIGAERDLAVGLLSGTSDVQLRVNPFGLDDVLLFDSSAGTVGSREITWDGVDNDGDTLAFGLGGRDLTQAGTLTGITLRLGVDANGATARFRLYQGSDTNFSEASIPIPVTGGAATEWAFVPFSSFVNEPGANVSPTNIDAIQLILETGSTSVDGQIDVVGILGAQTNNFQNDVVVDLEVTKTASADEVNNGDPVSWTVTVTNDAAATGAATGVELTDTLPSGVTFVDATTTDGSFAGGVWTLTNPLAPGQTQTLTINTTVDGAVSGGTVLTNVVEVTAVDQMDVDSTPANDDGDQSEDDEAAVSTTVGRFIDLEVTKVADTSVVSAGDQVTFTVTVTNNAATANSDATNVQLTDTLPAGLSLVSATPSGNGTFNAGTWSLVDPLAPGASQTLSIVAQVDNGVQGDTTLTNVVEVTSANEMDVDSQPNNDDGDQSEDDEANAGVLVGAVIDLELDKNANVSNVNAGDTVVWTVSVTNNDANANTNATNVEITDVLPGGLTLVSATPSGNGTFAGGSWSLVDPLAPGASATLTVTTTVNNGLAGGAQLTNTAQVSAADQADIDSTPANDDGDQSEDDEDLATVTVNSLIDLELTKDVNQTNVIQGDQVTWTVTLTNNLATANADATGVEVTDTLPSGVSLVSATPSSGTFVGDTWSLGGPLAPGVSETLTLVTTVDSGTSAENVAEVSAANEMDVDSTVANDDGDQSEDDEDNAIIQISPLVIDLELSKSVSTSSVRAGDQVTWNLSLTNNGLTANSDATGVEVSDALPAGVTFDSASPSMGTFSGNTWTLGTPLSPGATATLAIVTTVNDSVAGGDTLVNIAEVTAANENDADSSPGNDDGDQSEDDEDNAQVTVTPMIDLEVSKTVDNANVNVGDQVTWSVTVQNDAAQANTAATGVVVSDVLPAGIELVSAQTANGSYDSGTGEWTLASPLSPGDSSILTLVTTVTDAAAGMSILNVAEVSRQDQMDVDSLPGNDDGDQSEDDEDLEQVNVAVVRPISKRSLLASSGGSSN